MKKYFRNQIKQDLKIGIALEWKVYLCLFLVFLAVGGLLSATAGNNQMEHLTWIDYLVKIYEGGPEFQKLDRRISFHIPKEWLIVQFLFFISISKYPKRDLEQRGIQMILRSQNKKGWWMSKCIWLFVNAILYYGLFYLAIFVVSFVRGGGLTQKFVIRDVWHIGLNSLSQTEGMLTLLIMPCICAVAIGMVQILLSLVLSAGIALCVSIGYLVLSVAVESKWILGNYTMLIRNRQLDPMHGVSNWMGIVISAGIMILSILAGTVFIKKKEFI